MLPIALCVLPNRCNIHCWIQEKRISVLCSCLCSPHTVLRGHPTSQRILDRCMDLHPRCLKSVTTDRQRGRARKPQSAKPNWHAFKTNGLTWTSPSSGAPPTARTTRRPLPRCSLQQESLFRNGATQNRMCRAVNELRRTFSRQTLN